MMAGKSRKNKKNIAVIGAGYWGKNLVRNFHQLGALYMVCDNSREILDRMGQDYSDVIISEDYQTAFHQKKVEGVVIATPAPTHASLVRGALLAGKDVYVEKPLCLSVREGIELVNLARAQDRLLMVDHILWFHPAVRELKRLINDGQLGRIRYIYSNRLNMGKLRREENVLWSFAPHDTSIILGLLSEVPESVRAEGGNYLHEQIADTTVSLLNFASGIKAHIFVSWLHPFKEQKLVVVGDKQMAVFDDTLPWDQKLVLYPHSVDWQGNVPLANKAQGQPVNLTEEEPLKNACRHFIECMGSRQRPVTHGEEALQVVRVLTACQQSMERHMPITLTSTASDVFIHETAIVDEDVKIGANTRVWSHSHIMKGAVVGVGCSIGQNVIIGPKVRVGDQCKIQDNVAIYEGVELEKHVFCGPSSTFTNVVIPRAHISRRHEYKKTLVKQGATIGANATIICGHALGRFAFIGAGAVVTKDVPDYALMAGNPAKQLGWACECGQRLAEDYHCSVCGKTYTKSENGLELAE